MARLIQVGNLPDSVDSDLLQRLFEVHGGVRSASVTRHLETGRSTGVGFVEMASDEGGDAAIAALNHKEHLGNPLSVCWSQSSNHRVVDLQKMFGSMNMTAGRRLKRKIARQQEN